MSRSLTISLSPAPRCLLRHGVTMATAGLSVGCGLGSALLGGSCTGRRCPSLSGPLQTAGGSSPTLQSPTVTMTADFDIVLPRFPSFVSGNVMPLSPRRAVPYGTSICCAARYFALIGAPFDGVCVHIGASLVPLSTVLCPNRGFRLHRKDPVLRRRVWQRGLGLGRVRCRGCAGRH